MNNTKTWNAVCVCYSHVCSCMPGNVSKFYSQNSTHKIFLFTGNSMLLESYLFTFNLEPKFIYCSWNLIYPLLILIQNLYQESIYFLTPYISLFDCSDFDTLHFYPTGSLWRGAYNHQGRKLVVKQNFQHKPNTFIILCSWFNWKNVKSNLSGRGQSQYTKLDIYRQDLLLNTPMDKKYAINRVTSIATWRSIPRLESTTVFSHKNKYIEFSILSHLSLIL